MPAINSIDANFICTDSLRALREPCSHSIRLPLHSPLPAFPCPSLLPLPSHPSLSSPSHLAPPSLPSSSSHSFPSPSSPFPFFPPSPSLFAVLILPPLLTLQEVKTLQSEIQRLGEEGEVEKAEEVNKKILSMLDEREKIQQVPALPSNSQNLQSFLVFSLVFGTVPSPWHMFCFAHSPPSATF